MGNTRKQQIKQTAITATESATLRTVFLILINIPEIKIKFLKSIDAICGSTNQWRRCNVGCQWSYRTLSGISPNPEWWGCGQYGATVQKHWSVEGHSQLCAWGSGHFPPARAQRAAHPATSTHNIPQHWIILSISWRHPQFTNTLPILFMAFLCSNIRQTAKRKMVLH